MKTLVIGNGPAGISSAKSITAGSVVLVAPEKLPRPGVCGGVLTPPSCRFLRRRGMIEELLDRGARRLESVTILAQRRRVFTLPVESPGMLSMSRQRFDRTLFDHWVPPGVKRRVGYVRRVEQHDDGIAARLRNGGTIRADGVVDASGHRRLCSRVFEEKNATDRSLIGVEWSGVKTGLENRLYLVALSGGYAGIAPFSRTGSGAENGYTVSAVFRTDSFQTRGPRKTWKNIHANLSPPLRKLLPEQPPGDPRTKAGFWYEMKEPLGDRWVAVGDAAGFTMPLSGEGIWMAMREGTLAGTFLSNRSPRSSVPCDTGPAGWPLTPKQQKRLGRQLVKPFRQQLLRWKLTHFLGMHPGWITTANRVFPDLTRRWVKKLFPTPEHWEEGG